MKPFRFITITTLVILLGCGQPEEQAKTQEQEQPATEALEPPELAGSMTQTTSDDTTAILSATGSEIDKTDPRWKLKVTEPPLQTFASKDTYFWIVETNKGTMRFRLLHESAPRHVSHLIHLTRIGFYDETIFHRAIKGFMAQGGDPTGTGRGGPNYRIDLEIDPALSHTRGILSTANTGRPKSDGSQFFIMYDTSTFLDGKYSIFGELVSGKETLVLLEEASNDRDGPPTETLNLISARIEIESTGGA